MSNTDDNPNGQKTPETKELKIALSSVLYVIFHSVLWVSVLMILTPNVFLFWAWHTPHYVDETFINVSEMLQLFWHQQPLTSMFFVFLWFLMGFIMFLFLIISGLRKKREELAEREI